MRILAFDTSLSGCSVAYCDGDFCVSESTAMERGQAEQLVPMIGRLLEKASAGYSRVEKVAVTVGPGAFTGLRIALSTARALGLALGIPVEGFSTPEVIARKCRDDLVARAGEMLCILLETRRSDFYAQFGDGKAEALDAADIAARAGKQKTVFAGDALARFRELCPEQAARWRFVEGYELPDPCVLAAMAAEGAWALPPEPLYLRGADVSKPKRAPKTILERTDS